MLSKMQGLTAALAAAGALAVAAPAAHAMTVRVGDPDLVARVALRVPVSVSCTPFDPALTHVSDGVFVSVQQASGRGIASGSGFLSGGPVGMTPSPLLFACDGSEQTVTVPVSASAAGAPFHGGPAVITASANAYAAQPCFPGSTNCFFNYTTQSGSSGAVEVHL